MPKTVSAALVNGRLHARCGIAYAYANEGRYPEPEFSNSTGTARCVNMPETEAAKLIERTGDQNNPWRVRADGRHFQSRPEALGWAALIARGEVQRPTNG